MKARRFINLMLVCLTCIVQACAGNVRSAQIVENNQIHPSKTENDMETKQLYLHVNGHTLTVDLRDNSSVRALVDELKSGDITIAMKDYARFEKFGELPHSGDVILSEGNLLVIYYDRNSWNFTRLGKIRNLSQSELKKILGPGNVTVTVSLNPDK